MDVTYQNARARLFDAVRVLSTSPESIQARLAEAAESLLALTLEDFEGDVELKIKFARILDLIAVDRGDVVAIAVETAGYKTDDASVIAALIFDLLHEVAEI